MQKYYSDSMSSPLFLKFNAETIPELKPLGIDSSANFYRTSLNSNIAITIPIGMNDQGKYISPDIYLPVNIFNATKPNTVISYPNNRDIRILQNVTCFYDIIIQFKLTKSDGSNYVNNREIRTTLVNASGEVYDESIFSNQQPDTGQHDMIMIKGYISHYRNDIVKIKLNLAQNNRLGGQSDTLLTVFRITLNLL